jgi:methionyl-tRNA formyltransferase
VLPCAQDHAQATYAPMLNKAHGRIDWHRSARSIDAQIRALTPWPGAYCQFQTKRIRIHLAQPICGEPISPPGTVMPGFPDELRIATGDGALSILEIQAESGKHMPIREFLLGTRIPMGAAFT